MSTLCKKKQKTREHFSLQGEYNAILSVLEICGKAPGRIKKKKLQLESLTQMPYVGERGHSQSYKVVG